MNQEEFKVWEHDAARALSGRYNQEEIETVLEWFRRIKGAEERDLIGDKALEGMSAFVAAKDNFDLYNSLMARLFIYAPLILKLPQN